MQRCVRGWMRLLALAGAAVWFSCAAVAQVPAPDASVANALRNLASRSGVVFAGQVVGIRRNPGVVAVDFRVDQALLGSVSSPYTLREWGGLWAAGQHRYWMGERVVIFLHAPGQAGLTSPVDGMEGVLPIVQQDAQSEPLLDVRRIAARVLRAEGAPIADTDSAMSLSTVSTVVAGWREPSLPEPVRVPLPIGIVNPPVVTDPHPVRLPLPISRESMDDTRGRAALQRLLRPVDPEGEAVGESTRSQQ